MKSWLKHIIKKYFLYYYIEDRFSPSVQLIQKQLILEYQNRIQHNKLPSLAETGFRVFSI